MRRFALAVIGLAILLPYSAYALWAEPSCDPSDDPDSCNISAPLNVSSVTQTKAGGLTLTGALTANSTLNVSGLSTLGQLTVGGVTIINGTATFNNRLTYNGTDLVLPIFPNEVIADNEVSNTLTASIFAGTGSTSNAVDLGTSEVAGTLSASAIAENWVDTLPAGDTMYGPLTMSAASLTNPAISITQPSTQSAISITGISGSPEINLAPTGGTASGVEVTMADGTTGNGLFIHTALSGTSTASGKLISVNSTSSVANAYPINVVTTGGALRGINVTNPALGGYGIYGTGAAVGVGGTGTTYGVGGTTTSGYGIYGAATTTGYAGYFDGNTTAGTGVYITLSNTGTTTASKALEVAGKNGYGGYFTTSGTASTTLYAGNTGSGGTGITVNTVGVGLSVVTSSSSATATGIVINTAGGQKGMEIDASSTGIDVDSTTGVAIEANGDAVHSAGSFEGGQFYPNESAGNGIYQNINPSLISSLATSGPPSDVLYDGENIWVADSTSLIVDRFNRSDGRLIATYSTPLARPGVLVLVGNRIYVFSTTSDSDYYYIDRFNGSITAGNFGTGIAVYGAVYAGKDSFNIDHVWLGCISRIYDFNLSSITSRYSAGASTFSSLVYADGYVWATNSTQDQVVKLDPTTYAASTITVGDAPTGSVYDGQYIWAVNSGDNTLSRIDSATSAVTSYSIASVGSQPQEIIFDGANIWIGHDNADGVGAFNVANHTAGFKNQLLGTDIDDVAFDGTYLWGTSNASTRLFKIAIGAAGQDSGYSTVQRGLLMYNTTGSLLCLSIAGTTVSASATLTNCQ